MHGKTLFLAAVVSTLATNVGRGMQMEPRVPTPDDRIPVLTEGHVPDVFAALRPWDGKISLGYSALTGSLWITTNRLRLTSINIDSAAGIFSGDPALNLGGPTDNYTEHNIFKETIGSSFGSLTFGSVAKRWLSFGFLQDDLTVTGTLEDGDTFSGANLNYLPEPSSLVLLGTGLVCVLAVARKTLT